MNLDFLPEKIYNALKYIDIDKLYEIRLRAFYPITANYDFKSVYISNLGITLMKNNGIVCDKAYIDEIIEKVTEHSLYAFNDKIKQGYLTIDGIRIGLAGECVYDKSELITIKNITSLNIRIPHEIENCSKTVINHVLTNDNDFYNTLLLSPPFCGKTTVLKDLVKKINNRTDKSILIVDERGEFANVTGLRIDSIKYSEKQYAFDYGIRSMSPSLIITDELCSKNDWLCALRAVSSGVKVIASCHAKTVNDLEQKEYFIKNIFDRYIILDKINSEKQNIQIYNKDFNLL